MKKSSGGAQVFIKFLLLFFLTTVTVFPAAVNSEANTSGTITGTIINGTAGGSGIDGLTVDLYTYENNDYLTMVSAPADDNGSFTFSGISTDEAFSYEAVVLFKNIGYSSGFIQFDSTETIKTVTVNVYETTDSASVISISLAHTVVYLVDGKLSIKEILAFENAGDRTYIGSNPAGSAGHYEVLTFTLPPKATDVAPASGLLMDYMVSTATGFVDTMPVAPGSTQLSYTYTIPYTGKSYKYSRTTDYAISSLDILVQGSGTGFTSSGFTKSDPLDMGGTVYSYYNTSNIAAGGQITFTLTGLPGSGTSGIDTTVIIIVVAALVVGILVLVLIMQSRKKNPAQFEE